MIGVRILTNTSKSSSFYYVAMNTKNLLSNVYEITMRDISEVNEYIKRSIAIESTIRCLTTNVKADIYWTDEPLMKPNRPKELYEKPHLYKAFLAVSQFYADHVKKVFNIKVDDIVFRPYNPEFDAVESKRENKVYDIITIGKEESAKRKNINLVAEYLYQNKNVKGIIISDVFVLKRSNITKMEIGYVSEESKIKLIVNSKFLVFPSSLEAFGMPVLEAMALGTIPIYPDTPPFSEFAEGISFKSEGKYETFRYGAEVELFIIDKNELFEAINYALGLTKEQYDDLSTKCREKAKEINNTVKEKLVNYIEKFIFTT